MATSRRKPTRTVHVPQTAITSSARIADFLVLPTWLFITFRFTLFLLRHWYLFGIIALYFLVGPRASLLLLATFPLIVFAYVQLANRHAHPRAVLRATWHFVRTRAKWKFVCEKAELNDGPRSPRLTGVLFRRPPRIKDDYGNALEFLINFKRVGMTVQHLEDSRDYLASGLGARRTRIVRVSPGIARLTIEWGLSLSRSVVVASGDTLLPRIELDHEVLLELETSLLVAGESGAGKSNLTWYILNELNSRAIPYCLYICDPKKVELSELIDSPYLVRYADDIQDMDAVIDDFYDDMMVTFQRMKPLHLRRAPLGKDWPLNILIIDEILLCNQARQQGIDTNLAKVLSAGRAAGYIVIADAQLGQIDAIGRIRDLFPQRVCMRTTSADITNAVLGPSCEERGARCTEITEPGVGYIYTDFAGAFTRFRVPLMEGVSQIAQGEVWEPPRKTWRRTQRGPCYVFHLRSKQGTLLFVGRDPNPTLAQESLKVHAWWPEVDPARTTLRKYPSETTAAEVEREDIYNLHPLYNLPPTQRKNKKSA